MGSLTSTPHPPHTSGGADPHVATASPSRWQRVTPPVVLAGVVLLASLALHLRDPHQQGSWGFCPWLLLTGTYCPGCGGLRAVNDLTDGDVVGAASSNLLLVGALPAAVAVWLRSVRQRWTGRRRRWPAARTDAAWAVAAGSLAVFWVLRNLPLDALHWLRP